jgi:acyl-CoA reductase-like NAD-dependent aldehyde dehydrogenase
MTVAVIMIIATWIQESLGLRVEAAVPYVVSPPKVPEKVEFVEDASIKVCALLLRLLGVITEADIPQAPGSSAIRCYAPATGQLLGLVNPSTPAGIDRAIEQAHAAQKTWSQTSFAKRRQVMRTLLAFVLQNQEEICRISSLDSGKTMVDAMLGEVLTTVEKLRWTIAHGEKTLKPSKRPTNMLLMYKANKVYYEPLGVVAALVSWNYPCHNLLGPIISAIFAGNGIVVKASENTAWSANYFAAIAKGALSACGHDPNLVQSVVCWPQVANHLTSHPGISHITFIGSRPVAKHVAASAAKALIPVVAELGGKDAAIILDSAASDLPRIHEILLRGTFQSSGQNCIGIERIIACPAVYSKLVSLLEPRIRGIRLGDILDPNPSSPIDMGAMISSASFDRLEELIKDAVKDGARLLVGGSRYNHPVHHHGHFFQPTLLVDVTPSMAIANEECFAPICTVMRATSTTHAIALANAPEFGLGASVFGKPGPEIDLVVKSLKTGMVAVNDFAVYYAMHMPFGGQGESGYGRFAGEEGLRGMCNLKAVSEDRWGWAGVMTPIPGPLRYPLPDTRKGFEFLCGLMELGYGGWWQMFGGLRKLIRNG